eukprot:c5163_g1_i2.p1 GENE.c5163_g1_i2~~c5163_g1_i2.p1  ORF type:complete len:102 (-),score=24.71 c5163_g1_i2:544-849(-)
MHVLYCMYYAPLYALRSLTDDKVLELEQMNLPHNYILSKQTTKYNHKTTQHHTNNKTHKPNHTTTRLHDYTTQSHNQTTKHQTTKQWYNHATTNKYPNTAR